MAGACPQLALRHMFPDTECFIVFLARGPGEREVVAPLLYVIHRTDSISDDFWKTSAAENTVTIILGGKQINSDGKHDDA